MGYLADHFVISTHHDDSCYQKKEEAIRKETDGGTEQVVKEGETDHLRSAGHQHKPAEEGQSPLDSVL